MTGKGRTALQANTTTVWADGDITRQDLEQAIQRERMHALEQMVSGVAHNFNNVLMPIMGLTDLLLSDPDILNDREETESILKTILSSARNAREIVQRLREFYRVERREEICPVSLRAVALKAVALTQPAWKIQAQAEGRTIRVETDFGKTPKVSGNEAQLREVFCALLLNAAAAIRREGAIRVRVAREDDWARAEIEDTGAGMAPEVALRCFEPFFTTRNGQGSGLGLSLCRGIVRQHGGDIAVNSKPGEGTTVTVRLPLAQCGKGRGQRPGKQAVPRELCALVVDDEDGSRHSISKFLTLDGHVTTEAKDGREALDAIGKHPFDLVVLDLAMPSPNGLELARQIKATAPATRVMLLTGMNIVSRGEPTPVVDAMLEKPVTRDEFRHALGEMFADGEPAHEA